MFYPALHKKEKDSEGIMMHYGWILGVFILLFMAGTMLMSISGYGIIPTILCLINICVGFSVLPVPVAGVMTIFALAITYVIFPYSNLTFIITMWGSYGYFISTIAGFCAIIKSIISGKKIRFY